jgi:hypothetical protein
LRLLRHPGENQPLRLDNPKPLSGRVTTQPDFLDEGGLSKYSRPRALMRGCWVIAGSALEAPSVIAGFNESQWWVNYHF